MKKLEDYKGKVIKVLTKEHGKKVIEFWKGLGADTIYSTKVISNEADGCFYIYYGLDKNNNFATFNIGAVISLGLEIIELPEVYENAEPIPLKTKLTKQQIADKFGVDIKNIEIVD